MTAESTGGGDRFAAMTPEQLDYWVREIAPILVSMRERSMERARQRALGMIRRPLRQDETTEE